jgi:thiamine-phosphate pyrophosphorylase
MIDLARSLRLYLVADPDQCVGQFLPAVEAALRGGVTAVQLRARSVTDRECCRLGHELRAITSLRGVPLLVNDRVDIAHAIEADGVHLGVDDLSPTHARRISPPGFVIGYSPGGPDDEIDGGADYLGIGPVYATASKADAGDPLGVETFRARVTDVPLPVVGIGGIHEGNAGDVVRAGAIGVAVISSILRHPDPEHAARTLLGAMGPVG